MRRRGHGERSGTLTRPRAHRPGRTNVLGALHPETLTATHSMAVTYHERNDLAKAEPYYRKALDGRREQLGRKAAITGETCYNLAVLLNSRYDEEQTEALRKETIEMFKDCDEIYSDFYGPDDERARRIRQASVQSPEEVGKVGPQPGPVKTCDGRRQESLSSAAARLWTD